MRDILLGDKKYLLDNQILIICPVFNVDGNDTWSTRHGTPHIIGTRRNALDYDLNRDAIKLETIEVNGLYENIFNKWDPVLAFDAHAMGRVKHGYAIVYATSTVPAAHPGPRNYVFETMFPAIREKIRKNFQLETFTHCMYDEENWPPTVWSHEKAYWTTEGKFLTAAYALRNRMSVLVETPGHPSFERKIYAQYALITELLEHTNSHGRQMVEICEKADKDVVEQVSTRAESGQLTNFVEGTYESWGKVDLLAYAKNEPEYIPGTSVQKPVPDSANGPPELIPGVEHLTKPVGTKEAVVPRWYLIPSELEFLVEKLRRQNIAVEVLDEPLIVSGEQYVIDKMYKVESGGYSMTRLDGGFYATKKKEFAAGTYRIDMAQPLANLAFYSLEPQVGDGFVGWGLLDTYLKSIGVEERSTVYPIFKCLKTLDAPETE
jgi:dipeptidyl-peptidase-4